jgi:hypothetical protein
MMSSGFGSDAVSLTMKSWMSQERNVRETSSSVCSTRADPMHTDEDSVRRHMYQVLSRHMHTAGPPPSPLSCSRVVGEKGSLLPPTESGPDNTPAHMSWASYSQTANSVFSTKPSQVRAKVWTHHELFFLEDLCCCSSVCVCAASTNFPAERDFCCNIWFGTLTSSDQSRFEMRHHARYDLPQCLLLNF